MEGPDWWVVPTMGLVGVLVGSGIGLVGVFLGTSRQIRHQERQARLATYVGFMESLVSVHAAAVQAGGMLRKAGRYSAELGELRGLLFDPSPSRDRLHREAHRMESRAEMTVAEGRESISNAWTRFQVLSMRLHEIELVAPSRLYAAGCDLFESVRAILDLLPETKEQFGDTFDAEVSAAHDVLHEAMVTFVRMARIDVRAAGATRRRPW